MTHPCLYLHHFVKGDFVASILNSSSSKELKFHRLIEKEHFLSFLHR